MNFWVPNVGLFAYLNGDTVEQRYRYHLRSSFMTEGNSQAYSSFSKRRLPELFLLILCVFLGLACDGQFGTVESKSTQGTAKGTQSYQDFHFTGQTMGTSYSVKFYYSNLAMSEDHQAFDGLGEQIQLRLNRIEALMSTYQADSELMRFNRAKVGERFNLTAETFEVFSAAKQIHRHSSSYFDVTVGPLVKLWGFMRHQENWQPPTQDTVMETLQSIGFDFLEFTLHSELQRPENEKVSQESVGFGIRQHRVEADLSAIAKGYAVDAIVSLLKQRDIASYMVEVGGELSIGDRKPSGELWRIALEQPESGLRAVHKVLPLERVAVATSGNYRNYVTHDGKQYGHTLNPKTGFPVSHDLASVTVLMPVVASSVIDQSTQLPDGFKGSDQLPATFADGWATALLVAGPKIGKTLALDNGLAAIFIIQKGDQYQLWQSPEAKQFLQ